jgi:DNA-directed RNA polymerase specialized sigma24 family protein
MGLSNDDATRLMRLLQRTSCDQDRGWVGNEDVVQEAVLRVHIYLTKHRMTLDDIDKPEAWAESIARNVRFDQRRRRVGRGKRPKAQEMRVVRFLMASLTSRPTAKRQSHVARSSRSSGQNWVGARCL